MTVIPLPAVAVRKSEVWFSDGAEAPDGCDLVLFRECRAPAAGLAPFRNGVIPLDADEPALMGRFDKKFRYEVSRAEREGILTQHSPLPADELLAVYPRLQEFCRSKGIACLPLRHLQAYAAQGSLLLSTARHDGALLQCHLYFVGEDEAVLLASFPCCAPAYQPKHFGWGNRLLHWKDIAHFKEAGMCRYNLGGMGNPVTERNRSIVSFKMEMNPQIVTYYHGTVARTLRGRVFLQAQKVLRSR